MSCCNAMVVWLLAALPAADPPEVRDYRVTIDGKPAGTYRMTIAQQTDGSLTQTGQADVSFRVFIKTYVYTYRGTEQWRDGRLVRLESTTNDDGTKHQVFAEPGGHGLRVRANGQTKFLSADVWTMSFWQLPPKQRRDGPISLLDADTGKLILANLKAHGVVPLTIAGQTTTAARYQLTGGKTVDLWYDGADRLLRQEALEDGYRTVIELVRISR